LPLQELIAEGCRRVTRYQPTTVKIVRMRKTTMIENGIARMPE
jgi:hypothetical protein